MWFEWKEVSPSTGVDVQAEQSKAKHRSRGCAYSLLSPRSSLARSPLLVSPASLGWMQLPKKVDRLDAQVTQANSRYSFHYSTACCQLTVLHFISITFHFRFPSPSPSLSFGKWRVFFILSYHLNAFRSFYPLQQHVCDLTNTM